MSREHDLLELILRTLDRLELLMTALSERMLIGELIALYRRLESR